MQAYQIVVSLLALLILAAGVQWQFSRTAADVATTSGRSWVMPVSTPFIPTLCEGKPDCFDLTYDEPVRLAP